MIQTAAPAWSAREITGDEAAAHAPRLLKLRRAWQDPMAPCPAACGECAACNRTLNVLVTMLGKAAGAFEIASPGEMGGLVYFTPFGAASLLHGFAWDGRLYGKRAAVLEAIRAQEAATGPAQAQVPENSRPVARWLCRSLGFRLTGLKQDDFLYGGQWLDVWTFARERGTWAA